MMNLSCSSFVSILSLFCILSTIFHIFRPKDERLENYLVKIQNTTPDNCPVDLNYQQKLKFRLCPQNNIVTVTAGGRLGNKIWEYASVWAIAKYTGLSPFVPLCIRSELDKVFEDLSIPTLEEIQHCKISFDGFVNSFEGWEMTNRSILLRKYVTEVDKITRLSAELKLELKFRKELVEEGNNILKKASQDKKNTTFVGIHVRRDDYIFYLKDNYKLLPADKNFFKMGMQYFTQNYHYVLFILTGDSPDWIEENFKNLRKDVFIQHSSNPGLDLAILASCNHSIFDYGTFGAIAALLAGGETFFYDFDKNIAHSIASYVSSWYGMDWKIY